MQLYMAWIQLFLKEGWNSVIIAQTKDTARRMAEDLADRKMFNAIRAKAHIDEKTVSLDEFKAMAQAEKA